MFVHRFRSDVRAVLHQWLQPATVAPLHRYAKILAHSRVRRFCAFDPRIRIGPKIYSVDREQLVNRFTIAKGELLIVEATNNIGFVAVKTDNYE